MGRPAAPRLRLHYYDENRSPDVVIVGQWELTLTERKFGHGTFQAGGLEATLYAAYLGAKRAGLVPDNNGFDAWGQTIMFTEPLEDDEAGESPAPPTE